MATVLAPPQTPGTAVQIPLTQVATVRPLFSAAGFVLPTGALRIGGDSPNGLVLVGSAPAARPVWLLDMATGVLVATTTSGSDGTYAFTGLSARTDGYLVWIRGATAGEKGYFIPGVHPG
jgi:hypothetical protein